MNPEEAPPNVEASVSKRRDPSHWSRHWRAWTFGLGAIAMIAGGTVATTRIRAGMQQREVRQLAEEALALTEEGEYDKAAPLIQQATILAPRQIEVIRATARYLQETSDEYKDAAAIWRQIIISGASTPADRVSYARVCLRLDDLNEVRTTLQTLPPEVQSSRKVLEIRADLAAKLGDVAQARRIRQEAWSLDRDNLECRILLAGQDLDASFNEVRNAALQTLWQAARSSKREAPVAMRILAGAAPLSPGEGRELLTLLEGVKVRFDEDYYQILDGCVQADQSLLTEAEAAARKRGSPIELKDRAALYRWLMQHGQHDTVFKEITEKELINSKALFIAYSQALLKTHRTTELQELLKNPNVPLNVVEQEIFKAYCAKNLGLKNEVVKTHLEIAAAKATNAANRHHLPQVAIASETCGELEIAIQAYREMARQKGIRIETLRKVYQLQQRCFNTWDLMETADDILKERPGLPPYADASLYLRLLSGYDLETVQNVAASLEPNAPLPPTASPLTLAFSHQIVGDLESSRRLLLQVELKTLNPGQKAVYAGLLALTGNRAEAFAIAETLGDSQMLAEERWFLEKARS